MTTTIKKQVAGATRYVLKFDAPPSMDELKAMINKIDAADRGMKIKKCVSAGDQECAGPVKFVFVAEGETETDVPTA